MMCAITAICTAWFFYLLVTHLARSTPPSLMSEAVFSQFDNDVLHCFELSSAIELTLPAAKQATLNLSHGGIGLRSLHRHIPAAYISSLTMSVPSDVCSATSKDHLLAALNAFNAKVSQPDAISVENVLDVPPHQHSLSSRIEEADFNSQMPAAQHCDKGSDCMLFQHPKPMHGLKCSLHQSRSCVDA